MYGRPVVAEGFSALVHHRRREVLRVHPFRQIFEILSRFSRIPDKARVKSLPVEGQVNHIDSIKEQET